MRTSTVVMISVLGLAATPLALHLVGGSSSTTRNWIKTLHGGHGGSSGSAGSAGSAGSTGSVTPAPQQTEEKKPAPKGGPVTLTGKWTVTITSGQGNLVLTMVLKQEGKRVAGTITNPHGEGTLPVTGEVADRSITFAVDAASGPDEMHLSFKGAPKDDGTIAGTMTSAMGESKWTATRISDKR